MKSHKTEEPLLIFTGVLFQITGIVLYARKNAQRLGVIISVSSFKGELLKTTMQIWDV